MTDISLTVNGLTFTFAEGEVKATDVEVTTNIENNPVSSSGPGAAYNYDNNGCSKTITLTGILFATGTSRIVGYSIDTIVEQTQWLESLCNGVQPNIIFTSNYASTTPYVITSAIAPYQSSFVNTLCRVQSFKHRELEGIVNELEFTLKLVVGL